MRRAAAALLIGLGVFGLVLSGLMRFYVHERLGVAPLDPGSITVAQGTRMTVFYVGDLKQRTDVTVTATRQVRGSLTAPESKVNGDSAVWRVGLVVEDDDRKLVNAVEEKLCVDRRKAVAVARCSEQSVGDDDVEHTGLAYKFPFNTQKQDYPFWDVTLRGAPTMRFDAEDVVNGLPVYRFVQAIPATKIEERDVPGNLVNGSATETVKADRMYQNVRTVWVEPYSGSIVKGQEEQRQFLRGQDGRDGQILLAGTLSWTQDTVKEQVKEAKEARDSLRLVHSTGPMVLLVAGIVLLVGGVLLLVTGRSGGQRHRARRASEG